MTHKPPRTTACPVCGKTIDTSCSFQTPHRTPRPGHVTLCLHCGTVFAFDAALKLREADLMDFATLSAPVNAVLQYMRQKINKKPPLK